MPRVINSLEVTFLCKAKASVSKPTSRSSMVDVGIISDYEKESILGSLVHESNESYEFFHKREMPPGLVPDVPIHEEGVLGKFVRRIRGIPPPDPPAIPALPTSSDDDTFGYSHELPPIGLSAWLHLCRPCRKLCKPLTAYGVKVEDTVGFPLKRFVQPPYELPASVLAEEAAMMVDSGGTGAAAASASCADLPDETADARETDRLLRETEPYVRQRAAAMAAAAAVEEELRTSTT